MVVWVPSQFFCSLTSVTFHWHVPSQWHRPHTADHLLFSYMREHWTEDREHWWMEYSFTITRYDTLALFAFSWVLSIWRLHPIGSSTTGMSPEKDINWLIRKHAGRGSHNWLEVQHETWLIELYIWLFTNGLFPEQIQIDPVDFCYWVLFTTETCFITVLWIVNGHKTVGCFPTCTIKRERKEI